MTYKKLFDIKYNNKKFTIFIDENFRRTFLELNAKGEYIYPEYEDFKALNEIYNNHDPFKCFSVKKYTFKEKVRMTSMILASVLAVTIAYETVKAKGLTINDTGNVVEVGIAKITNSYIEIKDLSELDDILGYKTISKEEIHAAIDKNFNLTPDLKEIAHAEIEATIVKYPDTDLRVGYENLKTLNVNMFETIEELQASQDNQAIAGSYDVLTNTINFYREAPSDVKAHEIRHALFNFYRKIEDKVVVRTCEYGHSLDEAMNSKLTSLTHADNSYTNERAILDYLSSCVEFDFYDYNNKGIWSLIAKLKSAYPDIDIDYIVTTSDSLKDTLINLGEYKYLDEAPEFLNELFLLATKQINLKSNDVYEPFYNFARLFSCVKNGDLLFDYLNQYNEHLLNLGYANIKDVDDIKNKCEVCKTFEGLAFTYNFVSPVVTTESHENYSIVEPVDMYGNIIDDADLLYNTLAVNNMSRLLIPKIIKNSDTYGTPEFWQNFALQNSFLHGYQINSLPIYLNGEYLKNEFLGNLIVQIGCDEFGKVGYILSYQDGTNFYQSSYNLTYLSDKISFMFFTANVIDMENLTEINLGTLLSEANIKKFVASKPTLFEKTSFINDELVFHPAFNIIINSENIVYNGIPSGVSLTEAGKSVALTVDGKSKYFPIKTDTEFTLGNITLETVLIELGILNETTTECTLTVADISELLNSYITRNKAR